MLYEWQRRLKWQINLGGKSVAMENSGNWEQCSFGGCGALGRTGEDPGLVDIILRVARPGKP